eukprot:766789-Hanusia_phi.AAC.2
MIVQADAAVGEGTVVVHAQDTAPADRAVMSALRPAKLASPAVFPVLLVAVLLDNISGLHKQREGIHALNGDEEQGAQADLCPPPHAVGRYVEEAEHGGLEVESEARDADAQDDQNTRHDCVGERSHLLRHPPNVGGDERVGEKQDHEVREQVGNQRQHRESNQEDGNVDDVHG